MGADLMKGVAALSEKKCGVKPKEPVNPRPEGTNGRIKEFLAAYMGVRKEKGAPAAAVAVVATEDEAKLLEARVTVLQELFTKEGWKL
jgi:hypothetical protein